MADPAGLILVTKASYLPPRLIVCSGANVLKLFEYVVVLADQTEQPVLPGSSRDGVEEGQI